MNHTSPGEAAFPRPCGAANGVVQQSLEQKGMTMREWFAGMALQGFLAAHTGDIQFPMPKAAAKDCFEYADAMLAESKRLHEEMLQKLNNIRDAQAD